MATGTMVTIEAIIAAIIVGIMAQGIEATTAVVTTGAKPVQA